MPLRIAFDMDGVLADFEAAFRSVELQLFGDALPPPPEQPEKRAQEEDHLRAPTRRESDPPSPEGAVADQAVAAAEEPPRLPTRRKLDRVWSVIEETTDFWTALTPIDPGAVRRIQEMTIRHKWEVVFITQRPRTAGETVQRQTQRWLVAQGFEWPSVLVMPGSRGKAAGALHLDYLVDDSPKNCVDVISDSKARAILIVRDHDERIEASARRLGIGVVSSIGACLDVLDEATEVRGHPSLLDKLARMVGWKD